MRFTIDGPTTIRGTIAVSGAKNEALKCFAAALACDEPVTIRRVPDIEDVRRMAEIVAHIGATVTHVPHEYTIDATTLRTAILPVDLTPKVRAGLVLLGPLLHRFGEVVVPMPGGCAIGRRPIDLFVDGFRAFGCTVTEEPTMTRFHGRPRAARVVFETVSVTASEALLLLAVRTPGTSILENTAMEPEIPALAEFLNACGADIRGAGTPTITIRGVDHLRGGTVTCIPDRIETGALMALVAACGGTLTITGCAPAHGAVPLKLLGMMGAEIHADDAAGTIEIAARPPLRAIAIRTHEYPGLATDLQPPFTVALTQSRGVALVHESVFEGRLFFIDKLNTMGANVILCDPHRCVIDGPRKLHGTSLESPDIRAGIALLIAAACAHGRSTIENVYQIDRGFERIEERLRSIGVRISRES